MRFAVFGQDRLGLVQGEEIVDVTASVPGPASPAGVLHRLIEAGDVPMPTDAVATHALSSVRLAAPLPRPPKIIAAPVNYRDHQAEMAAAHTIADLGVFLKAPSSVIGHGATIRLPYGDVRTDQEGELAVVIGRTARHVPVDRALEFVFGYCCALDITVRATEDRSTRKSFDTFTPLGPWVVTADEVPDPRELTLSCWVDGELRQSARVDELIFGVAELIAYASSVMTLWPGDVLLTGTPAGVGPINDASSVAVQVDPIGRLEVLVSSEGAVPYAARPRPEVRS